jgi:hypothetical protein
MKRTLTTAVALAAGLAMTGLAQAQMNPPSNYETPGKPTAGQQGAPSQSTSPAVPGNSNPYLRNSNAPGMNGQYPQGGSPQDPDPRLEGVGPSNGGAPANR